MFRPISFEGEEISWREYLKYLSPDDRQNLEEICRRLQSLAKSVPLALVAVGSVLSNWQNREPTDIDLLLLPLHKGDANRAEKKFAQFIIANFPVEEKAGRIFELNQPKLCVTKNQFWDLKFPAGKIVQIFIRTEQFRCDLAGFKAKAEPMLTYACWQP